MRKLREEQDPVVLSKEAATHIGVDATRLGRIERGRYRITPPQISGLLNLYGITDPVVHDELRSASQEDPTSHWWYAFRKQITGDYLDAIALEDQAMEMHGYHPTTVHGLLQCSSYIKAVQESALIEEIREQADFLYSVRMHRQQVVTRPTSPVRLHAYVPESSLLGEDRLGKKVLEEQVHHLVAMSDQSNVQIRIIPIGSLVVGYSMNLLHFENPWPSVALYDDPYGGVRTEEENRVEYMKRYFEGLARIALPVEKSREFLEERLKEIKK